MTGAFLWGPLHHPRQQPPPHDAKISRGGSVCFRRHHASGPLLTRASRIEGLRQFVILYPKAGGGPERTLQAAPTRANMETMSKLGEQALRCGGRVEPNGSILVPAARLTEFLAAAHAATIPVPYIDCLFITAESTRPSMMLSALVSEFATHTALLAFADDVSTRAIAEAAAEGSTAFFEVGP
jgi:hypothetical protein